MLFSKPEDREQAVNICIIQRLCSMRFHFQSLLSRSTLTAGKGKKKNLLIQYITSTNRKDTSKISLALDKAIAKEYTCICLF